MKWVLPRQNSRAQHGFSLLEVMLAMSLLMVILLVTLRLMLTGITMTKTRYYQALAVMRIESLIALKPVWSDALITAWEVENTQMLPQAKSQLRYQGSCCDLVIVWQYAGPQTTRGRVCW